MKKLLLIPFSRSIVKRNKLRKLHPNIWIIIATSFLTDISSEMVVYLGFALAQAGWQIWTLFGLYGIYYATTEVVAKALVADLVPETQRGTA